jgi:hypothetical protein
LIAASSAEEILLLIAGTPPYQSQKSLLRDAAGA